MILFSQFGTFNEFQLWQEARSETIACRLAGELCTIRVKTSAAVVKGSSRVKIADTVFSTTTRWCTPVTQLHHNSCITSRSLVRPFGDLTIKPKLNEFQTSNEKKKKNNFGSCSKSVFIELNKIEELQELSGIFKKKIADKFKSKKLENKQ